ncbi:SIMPL domain-containing protein [Psychroflexus sp. YR1-1]|uniref:SIMPL domain-containing protein n=1 Tax=Psychroflexus aurantiacus TaxID=2709310 RepID=A0A6B3R6Z2_9FLAO|nr:SIMPL domain-containing protein [Psychroflexus aurantiacus]NEV94847.1 SIMPL domain-containing protein [Psychroflexus aurantiacus]
MRLFLSLPLFILSFLSLHAQQKNFIDQPFIEVKGTADTLVTPDRIYLGISISEEEISGNSSLEEMEQQMISEFKKLDIDIDKQLFVADASSDFKSYFFSGQKVLKTKDYSLLVYQASSLGNVLRSLQNIGIANVNLNKTEHSKIKEFQTSMKGKAVANAMRNAKAMADAVGQELGKALFISETNSYIYALQGQASDMQIRSDSTGNQEEATTNLSFDQFKISSDVLVRFVLK